MAVETVDNGGVVDCVDFMAGVRDQYREAEHVLRGDG